MGEKTQLKGLSQQWRKQTVNEAAIQGEGLSDMWATNDAKMFISASAGAHTKFDYKDAAGATTVIQTQETNAFTMATNSAGVETFRTDVAVNKTVVGAHTNGDLNDLIAKDHTQHTDTGTTEADYDINSAGFKCNLDTSSQTGNVTIETQEIADFFNAVIASVAAASAGIRENDGSLNSSIVDATLPAQTDTNTPFVVTSSSVIGAGNATAWGAFDHSFEHWYSNIGQPLITPANPQWTKIDFGAGNEQQINKYRLKAINEFSIRDFPRDFKIQGSQNDSDWVTLDDVVTSTDPGQDTWSTYYTFDNATAYRYYRVLVTDVWGNLEGTAISEIEYIVAQYATAQMFLNTDNNFPAFTNPVTGDLINLMTGEVL